MTKRVKPYSRTMRSPPEPELPQNDLVEQQEVVNSENLAKALIKLGAEIDRKSKLTRMVEWLNTWLKRLLRRK